MSSKWTRRGNALAALATVALAAAWLPPTDALAQATFNIRVQAILLHDNAAGAPCNGGGCMTAVDFARLVTMANRVFNRAGILSRELVRLPHQPQERGRPRGQR